MKLYGIRIVCVAEMCPGGLCTMNSLHTGHLYTQSTRAIGVSNCEDNDNTKTIRRGVIYRGIMTALFVENMIIFIQ